ncbi:hypothetical protein SAMN04488058_10423 [Deinococcus reticulitermitis]|uniref:Uncharacterized protein n=1 Tax=Deinococcus reticulitermitis TaxID=856736 RepID=A0A1H6WEF3_9DEIO|nr:hypothetical protein [Deinococcus reticulitermitis]SEJ10882.1 hypothetical protein SAMN04488058_10423 [Deinococcus reticulitermitis]
MEEGNVILSLIGPVGPMTDLDEYMTYRDRTIKALSLEEVLRAIQASKARYARFRDDVEVLAIEYAEHHPGQRPVIDGALRGAGFEGLAEEDPA